jgi:hypothetical protein
VIISLCKHDEPSSGCEECDKERKELGIYSWKSMISLPSDGHRIEVRMKNGETALFYANPETYHHLRKHYTGWRRPWPREIDRPQRVVPAITSTELVLSCSTDGQPDYILVNGVKYVKEA